MSILLQGLQLLKRRSDSKPKVDSALQSQLQSRGISEVSPEAVRAARVSTAQPVTPITTPLKLPTIPKPKKQMLAGMDKIALPTKSILTKERTARFGISIANFATKSAAYTDDLLSSFVDSKTAKTLENSPIFMAPINAYRGARAFGASQNVQNLSKEVSRIKEDVAYKPTEAYQNASTKDKIFKPEFFKETLEVYGPDIVASVALMGGAGLLRSLPAAQYVMGSSVAKEMYNEATNEYDIPEEQALVTSALLGSFVAITSGVVPKSIMTQLGLTGAAANTFMKSLGKNLVREGFKSSLKSGSKEAVMEMSQGGAELLAASTYREVTGQEITDTLAFSALFGIGTGSLMDASLRLYTAAKDGRVTAGLSIENIDNTRARELARKPVEDLTLLEKTQLNDYYLRTQNKVLFEGPPAPREVRNFVETLTPKEIEYVQSVDTFTAIEFMEKKGAPKEVVLFATEPGGIDSFNTLINQRAPVMDIEAAREEQKVFNKEQGKLLRAIEKLPEEIAAEFRGRAEQAVDIQAVAETAAEVAAKVKALKVDAADTRKLLRQAERINRSATKTELLKNVKTTPDTGRTVTKKESVLLKDRIRNIVRGAREGAIGQKEITTKTQGEVIRALNSVKGLPVEIKSILANLRKAKDSKKFREIIESNDSIIRKFLSKNNKRELEIYTKAIERGRREGAIGEIQATKSIQAEVHKVINESEGLTTAQKRRLKGMAMFSRVSSRTDVEALLSNLELRINEMTMSGRAEALIKDFTNNIEKFKETGKRKQSKLGDIEWQRFINWAFDEKNRTGFYQVVAKDGVIDTQKAQDQIDSNIDLLTKTDSSLTPMERFFLKMENKVLSNAGIFEGAAGVKNANVQTLQELYDLMFDVTNRQANKALQDAKDAQLAFEQELDRVVNVEVLDGATPQPVSQQETAGKKRFKNLLATKAGKLVSLIHSHAVMDADIAAQWALSDTYTDGVLKSKLYEKAREVQIGEQRKKDAAINAERRMARELAEIYGFTKMGKFFKNPNVIRKIRKFRNKKVNLGTFQTKKVDGKGNLPPPVQFELTESAMVAHYIALKNDNSRVIYTDVNGNGWSDDMVKAVRNKVNSSPRLKEFVERAENWLLENGLQLQAYEESITGVPFKLVENGYIPIPFAKDTLPQKTPTGRSMSVRAKAGRTRTQWEPGKPMPQFQEDVDIIDILLSSTNDISNDIHMAKPLADYSAIVMDIKFRNAVEQAHPVTGEYLVQKMQRSIEMYGKPIQTSFVDTLAAGFAKSALLLNPPQMWRQATSAAMWAAVYSEYDIPVSRIVRLRTPSERKEIVAALNAQGDFLRNRGLAAQDFVIDISTNPLFKSKRKGGTLTEGLGASDIAASPITIGDKIGITAAGINFFDELRIKFRKENPDWTQDMIDLEAYNHFQLNANRSQQTSNRWFKSDVEQIPYLRVLNMFSGTTLQLTRFVHRGSNEIRQGVKILKSDKSNAEGRKKIRKGATKIAVTWVAMMLFETVRKAGDVEKKDVAWVTAMLPFSGVYFLSGVIDYGVRTALKMPTFADNLFLPDGVFEASSDLLKSAGSFISSTATGDFDESIEHFAKTVELVAKVKGINIEKAEELANNTMRTVQGDWLALVTTDYERGLTAPTAINERNTKRDEVRSLIKSEVYTRDTGVDLLAEEYAKINKKYADRIGNELIAEAVSMDDAYGKLQVYIKQGIIDKHIGNMAFAKFQEYFLDPDVDAVRKEQVEKIDKRGFMEDIKMLAESLKADPVATAGLILGGEKIYRVNKQGFPETVVPPEKELEKLKKKYAGAGDLYAMEYVVPLYMGGTTDEKNIRVVTQEEALLSRMIEDEIMNAVMGGVITNTKARRLIRDVKRGDLTIDDVVKEFYEL